MNCAQSKNNPIFPVEVVEIGEIEALIDTGAEGSFIRKDSLPDLIRQTTVFKPTKGKVELMDGSEEDTLGCITLDITHLKRTVRVPSITVVEDITDHQLILGIDCINMMSLVIKSDGEKFCTSLGEEKKNGQLSDYSLPIFPMDVNGIGMVETLVDTGAEASVIHIDTLTEAMQSTIRPTSDEVTGPTLKNKATVVGLVNLEITYLGSTTEMNDAYVISNEINAPLCLGEDWIHANRVTIESDSQSNFVVSLEE